MTDNYDGASYVGDAPELKSLTVSNRTRKRCPDCGEPMEYVDEPVISGFRGYVCTNNGCPRDS